MTKVVADGADEGNLDIVEKAEHHKPLFAASIGSSYYVVTIQDESHILEIDLSLLQRPFALGRIESNVTNLIEQFGDFVVGHGKIRRSNKRSFCVSRQA